MLVYVDNLLLAASSDAAVLACKQILLEVFSVRDMGEPSYFLGMHVGRSQDEGLLTLATRMWRPS